MHGISVHSAIAIKRQRKRREEQRRARARRTSHTPSFYNHPMQEPPLQPNQVLGTITMLHIGLVFILISILLISTAFLPGNHKEMPELIGTGLICLSIGAFLAFLDRVYGQKEEKEITRYVEAKLGRTREGQRLTKDPSDYSIAEQPQPQPSNSKASNSKPQIVIQMEE